MLSILVDNATDQVATFCPTLRISDIVSAPDHLRDAEWRQNSNEFGAYRFCLVSEKQNAPGYISEKILNAFLARCISIPIYYGEPFVFQIFNRDAFIYYDIASPQAALDRVRHLESNTLAYAHVMAQPILANGRQTMEDFFSKDEW